MINDETKNSYYFAVKNLTDLISLGWLRGKNEAIINDVNSFQNSLNEALNYENIETHPEGISKIKPYISKYNWKGIEFPAGPKDWKKFEQNNKEIALNILFAPHNTETIRIAYRSEYKRKRRKQVILLMIADDIKWRYLAVCHLSMRTEKSSNHDRDFYCLNCFYSYTAKTKLKEHEEICNKAAIYKCQNGFKRY